MASDPLAAAEKKLRAYALTFPEAYEEFPWGERALKVAKKVFVFMSYDRDAGVLRVTTKLGESNDPALGLPFTSPTGYGLGKSGWVTATFERGTKPPVDILSDWIYESYTLVAPKKLVCTLGV
jgi:predicted DNA-binding protein (MmcQ/YjbR family)